MNPRSNKEIDKENHEAKGCCPACGEPHSLDFTGCNYIRTNIVANLWRCSKCGRTGYTAYTLIPFSWRLTGFEPVDDGPDL